MNIRFIYVYYDAGSRAIYVGSAANVKSRDTFHRSSGSRPNCTVPFDRFIAKGGTFTVSIVEALAAPDAPTAMRDAVARENHWMDVLGTYRTPGCFNFARASCSYNSEEQRVARVFAQRAAKETPEYRLRASLLNVEAMQRPDVKKRHRDACLLSRTATYVRRHKDAHNTEEYRRRASALRKDAWARKPHHRKSRNISVEERILIILQKLRGVRAETRGSQRRPLSTILREAVIWALSPPACAYEGCHDVCAVYRSHYCERHYMCLYRKGKHGARP